LPAKGVAVKAFTWNTGGDIALWYLVREVSRIIQLPWAPFARTEFRH